VSWSPDRSAVLVVTRSGRQFVANVNGQITDITGQAAGQTANWITGGLPTGAQAVDSGAGGGTTSDFIPGGVIENSRYIAGQQLRVAREALNIRNEPNLSTSTVIGTAVFEEYVAILAGPVSADNVEWWRVQLASGLQGWIAGQIDGFNTLAP